MQAIRDQVTDSLHGAVTLVVLGASGDLAKKKTYPALFALYRSRLLPENTQIIGYARTEMTHEQYLERVTAYIKTDGDTMATELDAFKSLLSYCSGKYDEDASWQSLNTFICANENQRGIPAGRRHRIFYVALPPSVFVQAAQGIKHHAYADGMNRVIIEKPFGMDTKSSNQLAHDIGQLFTEQEVFRIDHYLGKEMVKNVLHVRFANIFFGNIWNRNHIDQVHITFKEPFGTEGRGGYFDDFGIIRDVMQNHLLQVLTLVAMERPISTHAEAIRDEKIKVLRCMHPVTPSDTLLGQYVGAGGKPGYLEDSTLKNKHSRTPTFASVVCHIHNERWEGVPFILQAGKALDEAKVEVRVKFKEVPCNLFENASRNELVIRIQPDEAMYLKVNSKEPGLSNDLVSTHLDVSYRDEFPDASIPDAYEALILEVLRNDQSHFARNDEIEAAWKIFTPLLHQIDQGLLDVKLYPYGSRGPAELGEFMHQLYGQHHGPRQTVAFEGKL